MFENYEGSQSDGTVLALLLAIESSNLKSELHQIEIYYDNEIIYSDSCVDKILEGTYTNYNVSFVKNLDGYIYKLYITPETTKIED